MSWVKDIADVVYFACIGSTSWMFISAIVYAVADTMKHRAANRMRQAGYWRKHYVDHRIKKMNGVVDSTRILWLVGDWSMGVVRVSMAWEKQEFFLCLLIFQDQLWECRCETEAEAQAKVEELQAHVTAQWLLGQPAEYAPSDPIIAMMGSTAVSVHEYSKYNATRW